MSVTDEQLADALVPIAAELVGVVRDYGVDDVAVVLSRVPDERHGALAVVLAAMVDPDKTPRELLAWLHQGPVPSRPFEPLHQRGGGRRGPQKRVTEHGTERGYQQHRHYRDMPACDQCLAAHREANRKWRAP